MEGDIQSRPVEKDGEGAASAWLMHSSSHRVVQVQALAGDIELCSWAGHLTTSASLHTGLGCSKRG